MSKLLEQFTQLFAKEPTALEAFLQTRNIKTHADVEYWQRYFECRGI